MSNSSSFSSSALLLEKLSLGIGDRFAHQAQAQLRACVCAAQQGVHVTPVWNKSNREHMIVGSKPASVRAAADAAVSALAWEGPFHVDADHINLKTVDGFIDSSDFFTIDVADEIGKPPSPSELRKFIARHPELLGVVDLPGMEAQLSLSGDAVERIAGKYLSAAKEAGNIYRHIEAAKGNGKFITEVSMDETDSPQTPAELLVILAALADEGVPIQTIAPKFTGRFNKGVDYVGDVAQFEKEFSADIAVVKKAIAVYGLPPSLKLSVHSGSDKFSIYPSIRKALAETGAGVHVKTAGTTWLEELIGLAESGGDALALAKEIYAEAFAHRDELCAPYAAVIDIDPAKLPSPSEVNSWDSEKYVHTLRHDQSSSDFNPSFRQLLHVGYKIAAKMGDRYLDMLVECEEAIGRNVTTNLFERHIKPLFLVGARTENGTVPAAMQGQRAR